MANFDIASFNLINWANAIPELYDSNPQLVDIIQKDANGNLFTKTVQNRGMFQQYVWNDALNGMYKVFYVDEVDGDDNNDGSYDNPFKTIRNAITNLPQGGFGVIYLKSSVTIGNEDTSILITNKYISITAHRNFENSTLTINPTNSGGAGLVVAGGGFLKLSLDVIAENNYDSNVRNILSAVEGRCWITQNSAKTINAGSTVNSAIDIKDNTILIGAEGNIKCDYLDYTTGNSSYIVRINHYANLALNIATCNLNGNAITNDDYVNLTLGVIADSNGVPRNVTSNIIY